MSNSVKRFLTDYSESSKFGGNLENQDNIRVIANLRTSFCVLLIGNHKFIPRGLGAMRYENGPVVVSFEPTDEFMYYGEGIFVSGNTRLHQEWQKVN